MKKVLRGVTHYVVVGTLFCAPVLVLLLPVHLILLGVGWHGSWYGLLLEVAAGVTSLYLGLIAIAKGLTLLDDLTARRERADDEAHAFHSAP